MSKDKDRDMMYATLLINRTRAHMKVNGERDMTDSPCVGICSTSNVGDDVCIGCGRTAMEVIEWNTYTDLKKIEINERLLLEHAKRS